MNFSHRKSARIKKLIEQKLTGVPKNHRPHQPFWGPLAAIFDFAGGVALQAVSEWPRRTRLVFFLNMTITDKLEFTTYCQVSC